jgi:predicted nucleic acid-binding protein
VALLDEPMGVDTTLSSMLRPRLPARLFTDAYFAALATRAGLRLVTFDSDFARFSGLAMLRLDKAKAG